MPAGLALAWLAFGALAAIIAVAGAVLCRAADAIAAITGLTRSWVGLVLVATVTSLPELVTGVSSVAFADAPDVAVGDALGSCVFNLGLLGALYLGARSPPAPPPTQRVAAGWALAMLALVALCLASDSMLGRGRVGLSTPLLLVLYALAMRAVHRAGGEAAAPKRGDARPLRRELARFAIAAVAVALAGSWLPFVSVRVALGMGWSQSLFGTVFVAAATSLPELAVTAFALRMRAIDLAIGNLLGSNLFDMAIVAVDDVVFAAGPLLAHVSDGHLETALVALAMTAIALARPSRRTGAMLLVLYGVNVVVPR